MATLINFPVEGGGLSVDLNNADSGTVPYTNADMLGGLLANQYALKSDIKEITVAGVAPDPTGNIELSANDVGAMPSTYVAPVTSVNGKTGAVTLSIPNIIFSDTEPAGSEGMIWLQQVKDEVL